MIMMKYYVSVLAISLVFLGFGQNNLERYNPSGNPVSNIERYKLDYELVDESLLFTDSTILNEINMRTIDALRKEDVDTVINYRNLNIEIRIYSKQKAIANKAYFTEPINKLN